MNRFLISESEKNEILSQHNNFKSILQKKLNLKNNSIQLVEQIQKLTGDDLIKTAKKSCTKLQSGSLVNYKNSKLAIKITAPNNGPIDASTNKPKYLTDDVLIYTSDLNNRGELIYYVYNKNKITGTYTWSCKAINAQADDFKATASQQQIDAEGWMTYDEAKAANINLSDPKFYDQKTINGKDYFRKKGITIGGAGSSEQTKVIDFLINRYGNRFQSIKDKVDPNNPGSFCWAFQAEQPLVEPKWSLVDVVGGESYGVKEGLKIFVNPACLKDVRTASRGVVSQESEFKQVDKRDCKGVLVEYMRGYDNSVDTTTTAFQEMRRNAQACKRRFCSKDFKKSQGKCEGNWNLGLLGGSRKMDDIVDFFSGKENPIGTPPDRQNPYRLDNNN